MAQQWRDRIGKAQERSTWPRLWLALVVVLVLGASWLTLAERSPLHGMLQHLTR